MRVIETEGAVKMLEYSPTGELLFMELRGEKPLVIWCDPNRTSNSISMNFHHQVDDVYLAPSAGMVAVDEVNKGLHIYRRAGNHVNPIVLIDIAKLHLGDSEFPACVTHTSTLSPDGRYFASGIGFVADIESDAFIERVVILEVENQQHYVTLGVSASISRLRFSDDGLYLVGVGAHSATVWYMPDRDGVATVQIPPDLQSQIIYSMLFTHVCSQIVFCTRYRLFVWDVAANQLRFSLQSPLATGPIACSPDGKNVALATGTYLDRANAIEIWDFASMERRRTYQWPNVKNFRCLAFAPDGLTMAAGGDGGIVVWDLDDL
jgi:WD40 repeat protein